MEMKRIHLLAAELFSYSFDNYEGHLGINARFDRLMPQAIMLLERAEKEGWSDERVAEESDFELEKVPHWRKKFKQALEIVDAESHALSFLRSVRQTIEYALEEGLDDEESIDDLVGQIGYRVADLSLLLKQDNENLWEYSHELRLRADDNYEGSHWDDK
jgi:hypothetical protein